MDIQIDDAMPLDLLIMLQKHLNQNKISLCTVRFGYTDNMNCGSHITNASLSCVVENHALSMKITSPGHIAINKNFFEQLSPSAREGFCITILSQFKHIVNGSLSFLITDAMKNGLDQDDFMKYTHATEELSLLTEALKNKEIAHLLTIFLSKVYDPKISDDRYKKLFKIITRDVKM